MLQPTFPIKSLNFSNFSNNQQQQEREPTVHIKASVRPDAKHQSKRCQIQRAVWQTAPNLLMGFMLTENDRKSTSIVPSVLAEISGLFELDFKATTFQAV